MNTTTTRRPAGEQSTPAREQVPEVPAGEPVMGRLASFDGIRIVGSEMALKCRACSLHIEGPSVATHARMRQHHRDEHGLVPQLPAPVKKTPERAAATPQAATVAPPSTNPPAPGAARTTTPAPTAPLDDTVCASRDCDVVIHHDPHARHMRRRFCSQDCQRRESRRREGKAPRPVERIPCRAILTGPRSGTRRGEPCGRLSPQELCARHRRLVAAAS
ncbi:hypothetical protein GCM10027047_01420 [Rhodococcus aerolatus]